MVLVGVSDDDGFEAIAFLLDEAKIWKDEIDAWHILAGECQPAIDEQPAALACRPISIKARIHSDFAEPAERDEDQIGCWRGHLRDHLVARSAASSAPIT